MEQTAVDRENIVGLLPDGGTLPDGGLPPDIAPTTSAQSVRDAVVRTHSPERRDETSGALIRLAGTCGGILITPRVVASAAHCGSPDRVAFGQAFTDFGATPITDPGQVGVLRCLAHQHALRLDATAAPPCTDMDLFPGEATSLDWELLLLDRRVDAPVQATTISATPAGVRDETPIANGTPTPLRWVNIEHDPVRVDAGAPGVDGGVVARANRGRGRVYADVTFGAVGPALGGTLVGRGDFTSFGDDATSVFLSVALGDSGSPFYSGDPDSAISLVTVATEQRNFRPDAGVGTDAGQVTFNPNVLGSRPVWDADVRTLTDQVLHCSGPNGCFLSTDRSARGWFVGPADYPATHREQPGDQDGDGLREDLGHDDCPLVYDPDQADRDGDGVGDACDNCAPPATGEASDSFNPDQMNCNLDAELAADRCDPTSADCTGSLGVALGDQCDPIPCARTYLDLVRTGSTTLEPTTIRLDPIVAGASVVGPTGFRYCRCPVAADDVGHDGSHTLRAECQASAGCVVADMRVRNQVQTLFDQPADDSLLQPWRHITSLRADAAADLVTYRSLPLGPGATGRSPSVPPTFDWQLWEADIPRWAALAYGDTTPTSTEPVPGVLWTHSPHDCRLPLLCASSPDPATRALRSHYRSGQVAPLSVTPPSGPACPPTGPIPPGCRTLPVPDCRRSLPSLGPICPPLGEWPWFVPATFAGLPAPVLALQYTDVGAIPAASVFPSDPPLTATDLSWTALAEPVTLLRSDQTLRFVGIASDGSQIASVLRQTPFGFAPEGFNPGCPPGNGPSNCFPQALVSTRAAVAAPQPVFVLSASRGELFVIDSQVSAIDLDDGVRRSVPIDDVALGEPLAATYDVIGNRLFVLDTLPSDRGRGRPVPVVRLVSVDPSSDGATVLASWPRTSRNTRFALGAGPDGQLFVGASGSARRHVVARLSIEHHAPGRHRDAWDEVHVRRIGSGDGAVGSTMLYAGPFDIGLAVDLRTHVEVRHYPITSRVDADRDDCGETF